MLEDTTPASSAALASHGSGASVTLYASEIPPYAAHELARLYGNVYSSLQLWRAWGALHGNIHTYVERCGERIDTLLMYRREGRLLRVLNEGIRLDGATLMRFAGCVFAAHPDAGAIRFHAIRADFAQLAYPCQRFNCLEDIVLALPATPEAYFARLGGATRSYIKRYLNKLRRDFPGFRHEVYDREEASEQTIRDIIDLNRQRMQEKGKRFDTDQDEIARIIRLVRECGMVSVLRIGGRICAGTINYETGGNYFLEVIAHDPAYNDYRLGTLGCYLTICECIRRGGGEYHFLWGQHEYKFRLLGEQRDLDHVCIYRSHAALLGHAMMVCGNYQREYLRKLQLWLRHARKDDRLLARALNTLIDAARSLVSTR